MSKNPFEIRTEVLAMAKDYMDKQYELNLELARKAFQETIKVNQAAAGFWKDYIPDMYTMDDLIEQAKKMYSFVETK